MSIFRLTFIVNWARFWYQFARLLGQLQLRAIIPEAKAKILMSCVIEYLNQSQKPVYLGLNRGPFFLAIIPRPSGLSRLNLITERRWNSPRRWMMMITRIDNSLSEVTAPQASINHRCLEVDATGIFIKPSIPIKKPPEKRSRLIALSDQKPRAKNWFNPSSEARTYIKDLHLTSSGSSIHWRHEQTEESNSLTVGWIRTCHSDLLSQSTPRDPERNARRIKGSKDTWMWFNTPVRHFCKCECLPCLPVCCNAHCSVEETRVFSVFYFV